MDEFVTKVLLVLLGVVVVVFFLGGGRYFIHYCVFWSFCTIFIFVFLFVYLEQINALCCLYNYTVLVYGLVCERKE